MPDFSSIDWPAITAAAIVIVFAWLGVLLTLITLPGLWIALLAGIGVAIWQPTLISWGTIGAAAGVAVLAEVLEFFAGAAGASRGGSSRKGAIGALIGSIAGAILGSPIFFPLGTIVGGVIGAAVGTMLVERGLQKKTWHETTRAGKGAAVGRLAATVIKTALAGVLAVILTLGVLL